MASNYPTAYDPTIALPDYDPINEPGFKYWHYAARYKPSKGPFMKTYKSSSFRSKNKLQLQQGIINAHGPSVGLKLLKENRLTNCIMQLTKKQNIFLTKDNQKKLLFF